MSGRWRRFGAEIIVAGIGVALMVGPVLADQAWFDRHFLPVFFLSRDQYVLGERLARIFVFMLGVILLLLARPAGRLAARHPAWALVAGAGRILLAILLALVVSELVLRHSFALAAAEGPASEEPLRRADARLGWVFVPSRTGHDMVGGNAITYVIDAHGYRVRAPDAPLEYDRPSILFTGESIVGGYGVNWEDTIAAQTGSLLHLQSANMAVFGYANDQAYLRLADALPRFRAPVAVVSLFIPSLFVRNLDDDRPYLDENLAWHPGVSRSRLKALAKFLVPYHSDADIARAMAATRAVLLASAQLARAHHAVPLVLVPQFGPESPVERMIRRRILDEPGIAYLQIKLDPSWHLQGDGHPNAHADKVIAAALAARLRPLCTCGSGTN